MSLVTPDADLKRLVEEFLTHEADLADAHRFQEWYELWAPEGIYWVPCNQDDYDPSERVSIIYDDHARLAERCFRLSSEAAHSQNPRSRLCRVLGNVAISTDETAEDGATKVSAKMMLVEVRRGIKTVYAARCEYELVHTADSFKIRRKKVVLLDNDEPLGNLTFIL